MHERAQAGRNGGIVGRSETGCECGRHIAQEVISPRSGTEMQQQPRSLQIWHIRDAGEKTLLRFPLGSEDGSNVLVRTKRRAEDEETLAIAGESPVSGPHWLFAVAAQVRDVCWFLTRCIPDAGLAAIELDVRMLVEGSLASVLQLADSLRGRDNINVVEVGKDRLAFAQLRVHLNEGRMLSDCVEGGH